jgi:predicted outer membrane protein
LEPSIVTLLIIDNNKEIALGQLGQQTSQNDKVKQFCEMIVKDHASFVDKLQEQTASSGRTPALGIGAGAAARDRGTAALPPRPTSPTATTEPGAAQRDAAQPGREATAQRNPSQPGQRPGAAATAQATSQGPQQGESGQRITVAKPVIGNQPGSELLQLHHEIAEACLDSARRNAERLGKEFDTQFMGAQIVAHQEMLDKLRVFQQHVSPQTKQLLAQAQKTTQQHLEEAKSIHESLSKESGQSGQGGQRQEQKTRSNRTETRTERE